MQRKLNWKFWGTVLVLVMGVALVGCGSKPLEGPPTVPVKGKIVFTKNGNLEPIVDRQGSVEFESIDQPGVRALGLIQEDGTFTLQTVVDGGAKKGAVAGQHRVRLFLDESAQQFVAPQFLRFDKSGIAVTVAEPQSDVEIQIWR